MIMEFVAGALGGWIVNHFLDRPTKLSVTTRHKPDERQCASPMDMYFNDGDIETSSDRCSGVVDPRCLGFNCTMHCKHGGCAGKCLE